MLSVSELVKVYDSGEEALSGISFEAADEEIVAIIGPSGAGKSTLVRCINRLVEPTSGTVMLDDANVTAAQKDELRALRKDMAMVFQEYNLVERLTVMENVLSGRLGTVSTWQAFRRKFPQDDIENAYSLLERVGMGGHENDRADELSGGQRQRVGIARALMQDPKILLADEPTSSLDPETTREVMEIIVETSHDHGIPVLINIHDVDLAVKYSDRIIGLTSGEKVFDGPADDLSEEVLDQIYRRDRAERNEPASISEPSDEEESIYEKVGPLTRTVRKISGLGTQNKRD